MPPLLFSIFIYSVTIGSLFCPWKWLPFFPQCSSPWVQPSTRKGDIPLHYAILLFASKGFSSGFRLCGAGTVWFWDITVWHTRLSHPRNASQTVLQSKCPQIKEQVLTSHASTWVLLSQDDKDFSPPRDHSLVSQFLQHFWVLKLVQNLQREFIKYLQLTKNKYTGLMGKKTFTWS